MNISILFRNFVPLVQAYLDTGIVEMWYLPVFALAFLATVPCILKQLVR